MCYLWATCATKENWWWFNFHHSIGECSQFNGQFCKYDSASFRTGSDSSAALMWLSPEKNIYSCREVVRQWPTSRLIFKFFSTSNMYMCIFPLWTRPLITMLSWSWFGDYQNLYCLKQGFRKVAINGNVYGCHCTQLRQGSSIISESGTDLHLALTNSW